MIGAKSTSFLRFLLRHDAKIMPSLSQNSEKVLANNSPKKASAAEKLGLDGNQNAVFKQKLQNSNQQVPRSFVLKSKHAEGCHGTGKTDNHFDLMMADNTLRSARLKMPLPSTSNVSSQGRLTLGFFISV